MRLIIECEHGKLDPHNVECPPEVQGPGRTCICFGGRDITEPDAILAALAEAGVLKAVEGYTIGRRSVRYVSPWKEVE